eukprot:jgi/Mesvir1/16175/Mv08440-RA.1
MDMFTLGLVYLAVIALFLLIMLFGESETFSGTWVQKAHVFVTSGALEWGEWLVGRLCGSYGTRFVQSATQICCDSPNPALQIFYLSIVAAAYYVFHDQTFPYIPGAHLSGIHRFTIPGTVLLAQVTFCLTSFLDPGTLTSQNVSAQRDIYCFDHMLYNPKVCDTCGIPRPARSKHCSICNRCVARFDHHCAWMNNCIGAKNTRYFLAFLVVNVFMCAYGVYVAVAVLVGQVKDRAVLQAVFEDKGGHEILVSQSMSILVQWLLLHFSLLVLTAVFLFLAGLLMVSFLGYHLWLVARNLTTNETYKVKDYKEMYREKLRNARQEAASHASAAESPSIQKGGGGAPENESMQVRKQEHGTILRQRSYSIIHMGEQSPRVRSSLSASSPSTSSHGGGGGGGSGGHRYSVTLSPYENVYDNGLWDNFAEVLFPLSTW